MDDRLERIYFLYNIQLIAIQYFHSLCSSIAIPCHYNEQVLTFIRPGTMPGLLLSMIKELPYNQRSEEYMPLSRVQIYSAEDDSMSLNLFVYGEEAKQLTEADVTMTGEQTDLIIEL